jgi:hypothetical protein
VPVVSQKTGKRLKAPSAVPAAVYQNDDRHFAAEDRAARAGMSTPGTFRTQERAG